MKPSPNHIKLFFVSFFFLYALAFQVRAQVHGLGFASHDVVVDQRTGLDLSPEGMIEIDGSFKLSFDMAFMPNDKDLFGYIFRIIENDKNNIDLIFNKRYFTPDLPSEDPNHFKLIIGERFTKINFNIPPQKMLNQWNSFALEFDVEHNRLIAYVDHKKYMETQVKFNKRNAYKILFGINNYLGFKTKDTPPIKIRNVKITAGQTVNYFWPLNEADGDVAHEQIRNEHGHVVNPLWIRAMHRNWKPVKTWSVKGKGGSVAFNPAASLLYIVGNDSLYTYSVNDSKLSATAYKSGSLNLPNSNQSIYNNYNQTLYNYYIDRQSKILTSFDFKTKKWSKNYNITPIIEYWQSNSFFSAQDSSLYIMCGYGQLTYKNEINKYDLIGKNWEKVKPEGDFFSPRYLAALGTNQDGKTAYLMGGYGSASGKQILNPKNLYDLIKYDIKTKTSKKIYELKVPEKDFVFANSMIVDEKMKTFTALCYSNHVDNSSLSLFVGSLDKPTYKIIGGQIPFTFQDTRSFANLYYNPSSKQFVAVVLFRTDEYSKVSVYTLNSPADESVLAVEPITSPSKLNSGYIAICSILIVILIAVFYWIRKRSNRVLEPMAMPVPLPPTLPLSLSLNTPDQIPLVLPDQASVLLFGDLKLYDAKGNDITGKYTSLVKELFLVIFVYSLKTGRGISPEKLIEMLWGHKSSESARNNRSANLSKLRSLLSQLAHFNLTKESGNWKIDVDFNHVYVDYHSYLAIVSNKVFDKEKIIKLMEITQRGCFLQSANYPWLDQIKSEISNETIDIYLQYASQIEVKDNSEFLIKIANCIFNFDAVNEEAMEIKCRALAHLGKHSLASSTFVAFKKEYLTLYGEEFKKGFQEILE